MFLQTILNVSVNVCTINDEKLCSAGIQVKYQRCHYA